MASDIPSGLDSLLEGMTKAQRRQWDAQAARKREQREAQPALVEWLTKYPWEWFATLTFPQGGERPNRLGYCKRRVRKWLHELNKRIHGRAYRRQRVALYGVAAWERHKSGEWHSHLLVANTNGYRRLTAMDDWSALAGYARIYPPSPRSSPTS